MKLLVVLSRFPYPLEKGDKLRAFHQLVDLHKRHEIILCCLTDRLPDKTATEKVKEHCAELHVFKLNKLKQIFRLAAATFSSKPFQVHYFFQRKIYRQIKKVIQKSKPDHIYTQLVRTAEYVKHFHEMPKTLDYMDALNKNYSRRIKSSSGIKKLLTKEEAKRLVAYENLIFDYFEKHTIISEQDRNLIYHNQREKIEIVRNGVDFSYYTPNRGSEQKYDVLFTGNMGYLPNENAALFLVNEIMPLVWQSEPNIKVCLAGANPSQKLLKVANHQVTITGWVDDIRKVFDSSKVFIAPMEQGTGLQNKLLEAMSMHLPCVSSKLANNALKAKPNDEIYVYDNAQHAATLIMHLLSDEHAAVDLAQNGRKFIEQNYSWQGANKKLLTLINP